MLAMTLTDSSTISVSLGVLITLVGIVVAWVTMRNDVKHTARLLERFDTQRLPTLEKRLESLERWREREHGRREASDVQSLSRIRNRSREDSGPKD